MKSWGYRYRFWKQLSQEELNVVKLLAKRSLSKDKVQEKLKQYKFTTNYGWCGGVAQDKGYNQMYICFICGAKIGSSKTALEINHARMHLYQSNLTIFI